MDNDAYERNLMTFLSFFLLHDLLAMSHNERCNLYFSLRVRFVSERLSEIRIKDARHSNRRPSWRQVDCAIDAFAEQLFQSCWNPVDAPLTRLPLWNGNERAFERGGRPSNPPDQLVVVEFSRSVRRSTARRRLVRAQGSRDDRHHRHRALRECSGDCQR